MSRAFLLLLAVFLISTAALFAHRALAEAAPLALAAWRLGLASLFFLGWSALCPSRLASLRPILGEEAPRPPIMGERTGEWGHPAMVVRARLLLAGLCLALHFLVWFTALQYTPVARATLLVCTTPLWTTLGGLVLRRRRFGPAYWLAMLLAALGIALVTKTGAAPVTRTVLLGDLLATSGGLLFAVYLLAVEGLHETLSSRRQVTATYSVAAAVLWLTLLARGGLRLHYSAPVWTAILGMTLGPQIFGHTLLNWSLRHFPSSTVAFSILLEPVLAAWLAWLLFHQAVAPGQILGGLLVLASLALVIAQQRPSERTLDEPVG